MKKRTLIAPSVVALVTMVAWAPMSQAYETYSERKEITYRTEDPGEPVGNCKTCHGNFRATDEANSRPYLRDEYISPTDGEPWREFYQEVEADPPVPSVSVRKEVDS